MVRPASCARPAGVSPVPVGTGASGGRPRFVVERRRAERGVKSLFGGSKIAGRSVRGWGNYFRTGNATNKFIDLDRHVAWRLKRLLIKKRGRNLRAGQAIRWTRTWFHDQGLHKLMGTITYPKAA
jgi:hypothetical protein